MIVWLERECVNLSWGFEVSMRCLVGNLGPRNRRFGVKIGGVVGLRLQFDFGGL